MGANNATIVAASLDSSKLEQSINALVSMVAKKTKEMADSFTGEVKRMEDAVKNLGNIKIDSGGTADGGSSRRTSKQKAEETQIKATTQAYKEQSATLDQQAAAIRKANQVSVRTGDAGSIRNADTLQTMNIQLDLLRERLREARQQYSSFVALAAHATTTGDKGLYQFATEGVHKYGDEVRTLIPQIRGLQNAIQQMGDVIAPQGHTIQNFVNSLQKTNPELAQLNEQFKKGQSELQNQSTSYSNATQSAHQYTEEIRKQAQAIRESQQWKEKGFVTIGNNNFYNPDTSKLPQKERLSLEEQIYLAQTKQIEAAVQQEKVQQSVTQAVAGTAKMEENVHLAQRRTNEWAAQKGMSKTSSDDVAYLRTQIADLLGVQEREVKMVNVERASYDELSAYIKQLQQAYRKLGGDIAGRHGKDIADELQRAQREAQKFQQQMSRPTSLKAAMGLEDKTLDDIIYKIRQLSSYKMGLNVTDPKAMEEMRQVDSAINRLKKQYDDLMGKNQSMIASNNALGRSWNYMKNRLAFYFTVGASTQFVKNIIDIRGQYELLERSIGILIDSAQNGSQIFVELNSMAIKSPFTTMELGAAAKQLVAYDVAAKDVVDTTRRLADMAAAVGIPIERLTYALGQIKAYGYLNARDARMFANAGIPLVKELADRYTELEGRLVSTADVYDRIKKKAISYEDVMDTVNKMTDEGGKFFNFQEKAADTLKVRIANLTLAWNNMMNEMGKDNQGVLAGGLKMLKNVFEHWRDIHNTILSIITTLGVLKATQVAVLTITAMHIKKNITLWTALEFAMRKSIGAAVVNNLRSIGGLLARFANPLSITTAVVTALGIAIGKAVLDYRDLIAANEAFNKSISDNAKENITSIEKFFEDYKKQFSNIGGLNNADQEKLWERLQEEIEKTTKNAEEYVNILNDVERVSSRIRLGEDVLEQSKIMQRELQLLADSGTFNIGGGFANDSAAKDLQDYQKALNEIRQEYGSVNAAIEAHTMKSRKLMADYTTQRDEVRKELNDFVSKLDNAYMPDILGQSDDVRIQMANVRSFAESLRDAFIATEEGSKIGTDGIAILNSEIDKWVTKQGIANNLIVNANGDFDEQRAKIEENKTAWEEFFRYISNKDKEYLDAAIKTNDLGSDEVKKIWDKAAEEMSKRSTTSYNLIQDQIAQLRNTPDIVINVVYRNDKEKLDKDQEEFQNKYIRPKGWSVLSTDKYLEQEKANREKYGTLMRKQGEDTVEYEKRISDERKTNLELQKKAGNIIEENKNKTDAYSVAVTKQAKKEKDAADERLKLIKEVEDAGGYDFSTKGENAAARKAQKQAESELAKALKDELSTIEKVRSIYKELTKEGASHADAVEKSTKGWGETVNAINKVLSKNGLKRLNLSDFVGVDNPRKIIKTLQAQLESMIKRGASSSEIKVLQEKIQTLEVDAEKYDLTKITKGLNNELDRLKDEYELAVSLDADPELGNMFADWMGIDVNDLPRTATEYANRATKILNSKLKDLGAKTELPNLLSITDDDMRAFESNKTFTDEQLELVKKGVEASRGYYKKEVDDRIKDWDKLLEKYAEYEYKVNKIQNDSVKERVTFAQQFGNDEEKSLALNLQAQILAATDPQERQKLIQQLQELVLKIAGDDKVKINLLAAIDISQQSQNAKAQFEEFQKTPEWITATGELSGMTNKAIGGLIKSLEKYKKSAKNLDPKQIKNINNALKNLYKEQRKGNPFGAIADMLDRAKERMVDVEPEMESIMKDILAIEDEIGDGKATEEQTKKIDELKEHWQTLASVGDVSAQEWVASITSVYGAVKGAIQLFDDLAKAIGGKNASDIEKVFGILDKAGQGAQIGASFGGYGAAIGAVAGALTGVITTFADKWSGNASITKSVKQSELSVRRLENSYVDLQHAIDHAYGTGIIGAQKLAIANKELQLTELKRQLELEESRKLKNRDKDKILDLQKQIKELEYDIKDSVDSIVNDFLGISSVGDAVESVMSNIVETFRGGSYKLKDITKDIRLSFNDMIANMVMQAYTENKIKPWFENQWKEIQNSLEERGSDYTSQIAELEKKKLDVQKRDLDVFAYPIDEIPKKYLEGLNVWSQMMPVEGKVKELFYATGRDLVTIYDRMIEDLQNQLKQATLPSNDDIKRYAEILRSGQPIIEGSLTEIESFLRELGLLNDKKKTSLSALQAGIQGITEDTAGALEAYMNGVSQQVYLHSDLLTQIRDAIVGFSFDVQVATMSQILLQLQSSYTVQMSIQGILEGWSSPNGMAVRVEMQ